MSATNQHSVAAETGENPHDANLARAVTCICTSMLSHWTAHCGDWMRFYGMTKDDIADATRRTPATTQLHLVSRFQTFQDGIALYTACDSSNKRVLLRHFFGDAHVDEAATMLWFLLMLDQWRFNVPSLVFYCNGDESLAGNIQATITKTYFPADKWQVAQQSPRTSTAIVAFDTIEQVYKPCLLTAYIYSVVEQVRKDGGNSFYALKETFPAHWRTLRATGKFPDAPEEWEIKQLEDLFTAVPASKSAEPISNQSSQHQGTARIMEDTRKDASVIDALSYAATAHANQKRGDEPYINHLIEVLAIVDKAGVTDPVTRKAAVLHDIIEDTPTTREELVLEFGEDVYRVVLEATDDENLSAAERKSVKVRKALNKEFSSRACLVLLADKLSNVLSLASPHPLPPNWTTQERTGYFTWCFNLSLALMNCLVWQCVTTSEEKVDNLASDCVVAGLKIVTMLVDAVRKEMIPVGSDAEATAIRATTLTQYYNHIQGSE